MTVQYSISTTYPLGCALSEQQPSQSLSPQVSATSASTVLPAAETRIILFPKAALSLLLLKKETMLLLCTQLNDFCPM
jgi:hypothetical protein